MARLPFASAADRVAADAFFQKHGSARTLFEALQRTVSAIGKHQLTATRSRVAFAARTKFLWVHEANDDGSIWIGFLLPHDIQHVRVRSVRAGNRFSIHTKLRGIEDMDSQLVQWIQEAYDFDMAGPARPKPATPARSKPKPRRPASARRPANAASKRPAATKAKRSGAKKPKRTAKAGAKRNR